MYLMYGNFITSVGTRTIADGKYKKQVLHLRRKRVGCQAVLVFMPLPTMDVKDHRQRPVHALKFPDNKTERPANPLSFGYEEMLIHTGENKCHNI